MFPPEKMLVLVCLPSPNKINTMYLILPDKASVTRLKRRHFPQECCAVMQYNGRTLREKTNNWYRPSGQVQSKANLTTFLPSSDRVGRSSAC